VVGLAWARSVQAPFLIETFVPLFLCGCVLWKGVFVPQDCRVTREEIFRMTELTTCGG
jgi:hypothetical protein